MRKILIGYDGSTRGDDALALGRVLAEAVSEPQVAVATVFKALPPVDPAGTPGLQEQRQRGDAEETLGRARTRWPDLSTACFRVVPAASPSAGLQPLAAGGDFDVIVVGSSHRHGLGRIFPGSATEQTLAGSPRAVAIAPPGYAELPAPSLRRIGVGYDGTPEALRALEKAADLAVATDATLVAIDVVDTASPPITAAYGYGSFNDELRELGDRHLEHARDIARRLGAVRFEAQRPEGWPPDELVAAGRDLDLLVLGSRDHGPALRLLLGAVSSRVVRETTCPVLVIPRSARSEQAIEPPSPIATTT